MPYVRQPRAPEIGSVRKTRSMKYIHLYFKIPVDIVLPQRLVEVYQIANTDHEIVTVVVPAPILEDLARFTA